MLINYVYRLTKSLHKNFYLCTILVVILALIPIFYNTVNAKLSIIDDPSSYQVFFNVDQSITKHDPIQFWNVISEATGSRFRPFYNIYLYVTFSLFGNNSLLQHSIRLIIYGVVCFFLIGFLYRVSKDIFLSLIFGYLFAVSPFVIENIVRLGPVEFIALFLFIGLIAYYLKFIKTDLTKKDLIVVWLLLTSLFFTKEVFFVIVIPIFLAVFVREIQQNKLNRTINKRLLKSFIFIFSTAAFYILIYILNKNFIYNWQSGKEVSQYNLSLNFIKQNFKGMTGMLWYYSKFEIILLTISLIVTASELFEKNLRIKLLKDNLLSIMLGSFFTFIFLFSIQVPWLYTLERYFILIEFFLILSSFLFLVHVLNLLNISLGQRAYRGVYFLITVLILVLTYKEMVYSNIYGYNFSKWYSGFTNFEYQYTDGLEYVYKKYHYPVVYNFKNDIGNVEVYKSTNQYLNITGRNQVGDPFYLEDICKSNLNNSTSFIVIDRIGDKYRSMMQFKPIVQGDMFISQIDKEAIDYKWGIYTITKKQACYD